MGIEWYTMQQLILLLTLSSSALAFKTFHGHRVYRIKDEKFNENTLAAIQEAIPEVDIWSQKRGKVDLRIEPASHHLFEEILSSKSITQYETMIENVEDLIDRRPHFSESLEDIRDFNYSKYHTYEEIVDWTHEIAELHKDIVHVHNLGKSH